MRRTYLFMALSTALGLTAGCASEGELEVGDDDLAGEASPRARGRGDPEDSTLASHEQALVPTAGRVPLVTFYSAARGDYFTTTQPAWTCRLLSGCGGDASYSVVGLQGYVYSPDRPQPAGTVPLYHWWSPSRGDNFLTTDPGWGGAIGRIRLDHDGYELFRIEGYIPTSASAGSVPLVSFWNPTPRDNAAVNPRRVSMPAGWTSFRTEGHLMGPSANGARRCLARSTPSYVDTPWTALGNFVNTWSAPQDLVDGDSLQISAWGSTRVDFWGTHKGVAGEGSASAGFPAPGEPTYSLIGRVTTGRMWVPGRGSYAAGAWFPVGAGTGCLEYDAQGVNPGDLQLMINDEPISDNAGGPSVVVSQYW